MFRTVCCCGTSNASFRSSERLGHFVLRCIYYVNGKRVAAASLCDGCRGAAVPAGNKWHRELTNACLEVSRIPSPCVGGGRDGPPAPRPANIACGNRHGGRPKRSRKLPGRAEGKSPAGRLAWSGSVRSGRTARAHRCLTCPGTEGGPAPSAAPPPAQHSTAQPRPAAPPAPPRPHPERPRPPAAPHAAVRHRRERSGFKILVRFYS